MGNIKNTEDSPSLAGRTFVLTGSMSAPRPVIAEMIVKAGGKVVGSITKNTDYLVAGEGGGSKRSKAEKLMYPCAAHERKRSHEGSVLSFC